MIRRLLLAALVALTGLPALAADDKTVHIYNWSDYIAEDTVAKFEQETGYKVVYDVYDSNEVLEAKLLAGNSGYDVVVPSSNFLQRQVAAGVYLPLDKSKLPNLKNMDKGLMEAAADYDPDNEHAVIYMWGTIGIGYNVAKVKERLGDDAPVDSWSLVFDPKYAAKLEDCGITDARFARPTCCRLALAYLGLDPLSTEADDMAKAAESARERPALHPLLQLVAVHLRPRQRRGLRLGRLLRRRLYRRGARDGGGNGIEIVYSLPKEGAQYWFDMMAIPADAPNPEGRTGLDQLHHGAADHRRHHQLRLLRQRQRRLAAAGGRGDQERSLDLPAGRGDGEAVPDGGLRRQARPDDDPALDQGGDRAIGTVAGRVAPADPPAARRRSPMLRACMLAALVLGAAPALAADAALHVYNWADYIAPDTLAKFEAETGIKVSYDVYEFERGAGGEAPRRQLRLRCGGADLDLPAPAGPGRGVPAARPSQAAELEQPRRRADARRRGGRPGQRPRRWSISGAPTASATTSRR